MFSENMASLGAEVQQQQQQIPPAQSVNAMASSTVVASPALQKSALAVNETSFDSNIHDDLNISNNNNSSTRKPAIDREDRLRMIKDRQNEERQRKLDELKAQAAAAQKYREQKEEERRRRLEEMRVRELDRKQQVEDRKRAIQDAEKDRRDYILRKNQERESRIETKKRSDRSSIGFAFGSSTPRLLDPVDVGTMSNSSLWAHRRSTSISNVAYSGAPLSRRSSERELSDGGKKRATSAGGLDRNDAADDVDTSNLYRCSVARRKTDLMPTIPSPRDGFGSRSSLYCHTPRTPVRAVSMTRLDQLAQPTRRNGEHIRALIERQRVHQQHNDSMNSSICSRSGDVTPGQSRPGSSMSTSTSVSGVLYRRSTGSSSATPRKPRPASIAGTDEANKLRGKEKPPLPRVATTSSSSMRKSMTTSMTSSTNVLNTSVSLHTPKETPKRVNAPERRGSTSRKQTPRPVSALVSSTHSIPASATPLTPKSAASSKQPTPEPQLPVQQQPQQLAAEPSADVASALTTEPSSFTDETSSTTTTTVKTEIKMVASSTVESIVNEAAIVATLKKSNSLDADDAAEPVAELAAHDEPIANGHNGHDVVEAATVSDADEPRESSPAPAVEQLAVPDVASAFGNSSAAASDVMTASMIKRSMISTEEEAKAALAERRRLARVEAERKAELERQRIEAEQLAEEQRQAAEEERQRRFEEETLRLAEDQRRAEDLRLTQAIEEAARREQEERERAEEEERARVERERDEQRAREEAERQKVEMAERLKKEEKEREDRRKRVEAIMARTRAKGGNGTPNTTPSKPSSDESKAEQDKQSLGSSDSASSSASSSSNNSISASDLQAQPLPQTPDVVPAVPADNEPVEPTTEAVVVEVVADAEHNHLVEPAVEAPKSSSVSDYEKSVTDKENALINSFSNLIIGNGQPKEALNNGSADLLNGLTEKTVIMAQSNGKQSLNFDLLNEADDSVLLTTNGNNGHHHHHLERSLDNEIDESIGNNSVLMIDTSKSNVVPDADEADLIVTIDGTSNEQQQKQQQLIDFGLESATAINNNHNNNGALLIDNLIDGNAGESTTFENLVNLSATTAALIETPEHKEISLL